MHVSHSYDELALLLVSCDSSSLCHLSHVSVSKLVVGGMLESYSLSSSFYVLRFTAVTIFVSSIMGIVYRNIFVFFLYSIVLIWCLDLLWYEHKYSFIPLPSCITV